MIYISNFGRVSLGPLFTKATTDLVPDLEASKRSRRYKAARTRLDDLETAISVLAELYWAADKPIKTP